MRKGKLVKPKLPNSHNVGDGPHIVVRNAYELSSTHIVKEKKITRMVLCVDILTPEGKIIKGVACSILEAA